MIRGNRGFTLIELMVTIAVLAIIAAMAAPSFSDMILSQNLNRSTQNLAITLNETRSKAALERRTMTVNLLKDDVNTLDVVNWKPSGDVILKAGSPTTITFDIAGGVLGANKDTIFQICNKSGGVKSKIITISKMGVIQQTTGGAC